MRTITSMVSPTREKIAAEMGISEEEAEETESYLKKRGIKKDDDS
jgi:DNA-directed RNA polymerase specialized sigma subunit